MWIFHPGVARLRKQYDLIVKIECHEERDVAGRREGRVLAETTPLSHPFPNTIPPSVTVRFVDGKHVQRTELLPVRALRVTAKLRNKGMHVITKGDRIGTLVNHIRTSKGLARVVADGADRLEAFSIEKGKMCIVEKSMCVISTRSLRPVLT